MQTLCNQIKDHLNNVNINICVCCHTIHQLPHQQQPAHRQIYDLENVSNAGFTKYQISNTEMLCDIVSSLQHSGWFFFFANQDPSLVKTYMPLTTYYFHVFFPTSDFTCVLRTFKMCLFMVRSMDTGQGVIISNLSNCKSFYFFVFFCIFIFICFYVLPSFGCVNHKSLLCLHLLIIAIIVQHITPGF